MLAGFGVAPLEWVFALPYLPGAAATSLVTRQAGVRAAHHAAAPGLAGCSRTSPSLPMQIGHRARRCASPAVGDERVWRRHGVLAISQLAP
jgi:hypothetical protein